MIRWVYVLRSTGRLEVLTEEEARAELRGSFFFPWVWLAYLTSGLPIVTDRATYGISRAVVLR